MAGTVSLFQKYRSQSFDDLVGQEIVIRTLSNAIKNGTLAQAYLFCGPRGTGKTSTARILAKALNCEQGPTMNPCNCCSSCRSITDGSNVDLIELDAASNTGVDKVRDLIVDKVQYAPAQCRYKVYIIDEVHMLSTSAFNALLKTLEEPPAHVIFILCTTDPHKLLPTIRSRCQRHDFQRFTLAQIGGRVKYVAENEGMECSDEAADLIARAADGSMRDALSELGAVAALSDGHITAEMVEMALGLSGNDSIRRLVDSIAKGDAPAALSQLEQIVNTGRDLVRLANELCEHMRRLMLIMVGAANSTTFDVPEDVYQAMAVQSKQFNLAKIMAWIGAIINLQASLAQSNNARILWEMLVIRLAVPGAEDTVQSLARRVERLEVALSNGTALPALPAAANSVAPAPTTPAPAASRRSPARESSSSAKAESPKSDKEVLAKQLSKYHNMMGAAKPENQAPKADAAIQKSAEASSETSPTANNLGWGDVGPSRVARPAPKNSPVVAKAKAGERVTADISKAAPSQQSVRDSWDAPKSRPKQPLPSVPVATSAELADLRNLWLGFLKHVEQSELQNLHITLTEVRRFEFKGSTLEAYLPASYTAQLDELMQNAPELNKLMRSYRSNITMVRFHAEDDNRVQVSSKDEYEGFLRQIISTFGAEEVKE